MKYINKYIKFFENETLVEPINQTKTPKKTDKIENKTASELDVLSRFEKIYSGLSGEEKAEINQYFEK
jgi:hypothetical protein